MEESNKNKTSNVTKPSGASIVPDDDASWTSKSSADALLKNILNDHDPMDDDMVIEIAGQDNAFDALVEPLEDIDEDFSTYDSTQKENSPDPASQLLQTVPAEGETTEADQRQIAASISHDSSGSGEESNKISSLDEDEISSLLKGELLEPQMKPRPVTPNDAHASPAHDIIYRVMAILRHLETPEVVSQAEEILRECQFYHQKGDRRFQELPRSVFDRLCQLLGIPKFNEIYHRANDPRAFGAQIPGPQHGPSDVELAIAYGIHIARSTNGKEAPIQLVHHGMEALHSMSNKERVMFWNYMTKKQQA